VDFWCLSFGVYAFSIVFNCVISLIQAYWDQVHARELYIYADDPDEDLNVADVEAFQPLAKSLSTQLRAGWRNAMPKRGGGQKQN
jgi:hypothetical protein